MGWRFYRRIRVLPGVRVNISKTGTSLSIGTRGAQTTIGRGRIRQTFGIPGTGLSYTRYIRREGRGAIQPSPLYGPPSVSRPLSFYLIVAVTVLATLTFLRFAILR